MSFNLNALETEQKRMMKALQALSPKMRKELEDKMAQEAVQQVVTLTNLKGQYQAQN